MKYIFWSIISFTVVFLKSQTTYRINDFAQNYYIIVTQADKNENSHHIAQFVTLYEKTTDKLIVSEGDSDLEEIQGNQKPEIAFIKDFPNLLMGFYQDYNFDGVKDLWVDDYYSVEEGCIGYTGRIYLLKNGTLVFNKELTEISDIRCCKSSYFYPDNKTNTLLSSVRTGISTYAVKIYKVVNDIPKLIKEGEEENYDFYYTFTGKELKEGKWQEISYKKLDENNLDIKRQLVFDTENRKGKIVLFTYENNLYYVFMNKKEEITFAYPSSSDESQKQRFKIENDKDIYNLKFNSGSVKYIIYEETGQIGIKIYVNRKETIWKGIFSSKTGNLKNIFTQKLNNITL